LGERTRIESEMEIKAYLQNLRYALDHGAKINFQLYRRVDDQREERYTNQYTIQSLFPDEDPVKALHTELLKITVEDYIETVKDLRFANRSEMRVFGRTYLGEADVYIKIRVELLDVYGNDKIFVMSFHFAERAFSKEIFPYRKDKGVSSCK